MGCSGAKPAAQGNLGGLNVQESQASAARSTIEAKIVLLGDSGVGKSSLALRFCQETRLICLNNLVASEQNWRKIWGKREAEDRAAGRIKEPSRWVLGKFGKPELLPEGWVQTKFGPVPGVAGPKDRPPSNAPRSVNARAASSRADSSTLTRLSPKSSLQKMQTSHSMSEMKRSFHMDTSVLSPKYSPALSPSRRRT
eukprot:TRINITY_DN4894_c0_g1_i1.p1 TRINITY_DN4894_c0_g1~~TRINITY_DN4894_c0_g1_i1.p1  ORF type:complete len:197 (+),score=33.25 TRINITY_DN4894_c0_g1_i1:106-696(+)